MGFLKLKQAAKELGVSYDWLRRMAIKGLIPAIRTELKTEGKGTWKVNVDQAKEAMLKLAA